MAWSAASHTITLSDDGIAYSFGSNDSGQSGFGYHNIIMYPERIPDLPKIKQVSCGGWFTVCVDLEGIVWSFGANNSGQLGTEKFCHTQKNPYKVLGIPPVISVACGLSHTLIITEDSDLWSCGDNLLGQLFLKHRKDLSKFQKTSFSNVSKISAGYRHSLFQNNAGEIFSCGYNSGGETGLGHFRNVQVIPGKIKLPSCIVQFVCGGNHNLFLDVEGNVFSVGCNLYGQLGLGHNEYQNRLKKISNIPPIQTISCITTSSYLIDFEGNLWSFGNNAKGQLGHGDTINRNVPTKIESLKDIQQVSYGSCGEHFLAKDSHNTIFAAGNNKYVQLGIVQEGPTVGDVTTPKEIDKRYSSPIWGDGIKYKAKSARK